MRVQELFNLRGKAAVVTGGYTGLGKQMAEALLEAGADVAVCARKVERWAESFEELKAKAQAEGRGILGIRCDVSNGREVEVMMSQVVERFGGVDVLVNNAGLAWKASPEEVQLEDWRRVLDVNVSGALLCSQAAGRLMMRRGGGKIINMSSVAGILGTDKEILDSIAYNTSKAAIVGFTRDLAAKWARHNIQVNAIAPGWFRTHLTEQIIQRSGDKIVEGIPLGRLGGADDVKGAVVFLASRASDYVTGQVFIIDGGESIL